jgi:putative ABC transport system substrate-binding protein
LQRRTFIAFIACIAGSALTRGNSTRAQGAPGAVVGFLCGESAVRWIRLVTSFRAGLSETGFVEGKNLHIEFRWAEGQDARLPALAADLVNRKVDVLVATGGPNPALAAKSATSRIPIVFTLGADPVKLGLVDSLSRPGGNVTGVNFATGDVSEKRLQLLHELVPNAKSIAVLAAPDNPNFEVVVRQVQGAARKLGLQVHVLRAQTEAEIDAAFASLVRTRAEALFIGSDGFFFDQRSRIAALAARYAVPACYELREFVEVGGLMSYGADLTEIYRQAGAYAGKILGGLKPADLPILQPVKFQLSINRKSADALGIKIPPSIQLRTDELIQ